MVKRVPDSAKGTIAFVRWWFLYGIWAWEERWPRMTLVDDITQKQKNEEYYYFVLAQNNRATISFNGCVAFEY